MYVPTLVCIYACMHITYFMTIIYADGKLIQTGFSGCVIISLTILLLVFK